MSNLIDLQRDYVLKILDNIKTDHDIKFLVIDEFVQKFFDSIFKDPQELLSHVTSVDRIDSPKRKGQSSVDVVYFLQPTKFNMNCMDADFQLIPPKYHKAHVRFLSGSEPHVIKFFSSKKYINQYSISTEEVKLAFIPKEAQFFQTMNIDKPLQLFYNQNCNNLIEKNIRRTAQSLLNLCIITGEYPIIRYSKATESQLSVTPAAKLAEKLAFEFQNCLDSYARQNQDFPPPSERPRSIMLITDRTLDPFSLFLHDFSYQAMAYDLVPKIDVRNDIYHYKAENEKGEFEDKESKLADIRDPDWVELRHQHIMDANEYLSGKLKEMIAKNPLLVDRSNVKNTSDLLSVVAHLKDFDEERRRIVLHKTLIEQCLLANQERKLAEMADVEQNLAGFGINMDGEKCKHITNSLLQALSSKGPSTTDKVRYIIIYSLYRGGIIEADFMKLLSFIGITEQHEHFRHFLTLFKNFNTIAFKLVKDEPRNKPFIKEWFHDSITKDSNIFTTSRFVPAVGNILSNVITNPLLLSEEAFPFVKDKPIELLDDEERERVGAGVRANSSTSLRNPRHKAAWTKTSSSLQSNQIRQRFFYYSVGGLTYTEIKAAYDQSILKNKDVFIGSDGVLTPCSAMKSLEYITRSREELKLRDDEKEDDTIPQFLLRDLKPVAAPVSHIHNRSHMEQKKPVTKMTPAVKEPEKEKKRGKFSRFLRSKHKD